MKKLLKTVGAACILLASNAVYSTMIPGEITDTYIDFAAMANGSYGESVYNNELLISDIGGTGVDLKITSHQFWNVFGYSGVSSENPYLDSGSGGLGSCKQKFRSSSWGPDEGNTDNKCHRGGDSLDFWEYLTFTFYKDNSLFNLDNDFNAYFNYGHNNPDATSIKLAMKTGNEAWEEWTFENNGNPYTFASGASEYNIFNSSFKPVYVAKLESAGGSNPGIFGVPVPEPSQLVLLGIGLIGLTLRKKKAIISSTK